MTLFYWQDPIEWEKDILGKMVRLYCKAKHQNNNPCNECLELLAYSNKRLDSCKYGKIKPTCGKCPVHCYKPVMRDRVKAVMRYAGPRMMLYHPFAAVWHVIKSRLVREMC